MTFAQLREGHPGEGRDPGGLPVEPGNDEVQEVGV
jgi:hypothetical protein